MPITDRDIWTSANMLIKRYGADAKLRAGMRADVFLDKGDLDGQAVWLRIIRAIDELQRGGRRDDEPLH
jgi:hypothetical protein